MSRNRNLHRNAKLLRTIGLLLAWTGLGLLPLAAAGCSHKASADTSDDHHGTTVTTANPQRKDMIRVVVQPGYLRPYEQTPIYTKIAGFAKEPRFDIGDRVKKDELLVELYVPEVVQELRVKAAKIIQAKADLQQAKEFALSAQAGREAAKADIEAKLARIRSVEAQVHRWEAEETRSRNC